jgi:hypothetical protein
MPTLLRTWIGLAALGAGCIHLAVAAGAPLAALLGFSLLGAAELAWAVAALARREIPLARLALGGAAAAVVVELGVLLVPAAGMHHGSGMALSAGMQSVPPLPLLGAAILDLGVAAVLAGVLRRRPEPSDTVPPVWGYLAGVVAGAGLVAALTSASLGATPVGALAMSGMHMGH